MDSESLEWVIVGLLLLTAVLFSVILRQRKLLFTDDLTLVGSRRGLTKYIDALRHTARHMLRVEEHVVVVVDVNHFKSINDNHGHRAGDEILRDVGLKLNALLRVRTFSSRLKAMAEAEGFIARITAFIHGRGNGKSYNDFIARIGGDEFVCLLYHCPMAAAEARCEAIQRALNGHCVVGGVRIEYTCSIGYAAYRTDQEWQEAFDVADAAMYAAKKARRSGVVVPIRQ